VVAKDAEHVDMGGMTPKSPVPEELPRVKFALPRAIARKEVTPPPVRPAAKAKVGDDRGSEDRAERAAREARERRETEAREARRRREEERAEELENARRQVARREHRDVLDQVGRWMGPEARRSL